MVILFICIFTNRLPFDAGPCQFPTLGFVVQRYTHVKAFRPESFWYIYLSLTRQSTSQAAEEETRFHWKRYHLFSQAVVIEIYTMMMENPIARVRNVTSKTTKKWFASWKSHTKLSIESDT